MRRHLQSSLWFGLLSGALIGLFSLIVFGNLGFYKLLGLSGGFLLVLSLLWLLLVPLGLSLGLKILSFLPLSESFTRQFSRYAIIGVLNTLLSLTVFNLLMTLSGITQGHLISLFSAVTFIIVITHAFIWNKFLIFHSDNIEVAHREYAKFFIVSGATASFNVLVISILVNLVGPLWGISPKLWANIAVLTTVPVSVLGNFFGYKFFVFKKNLI